MFVSNSTGMNAVACVGVGGLVCTQSDWVSSRYDLSCCVCSVLEGVTLCAKRYHVIYIEIDMEHAP